MSSSSSKPSKGSNAAPAASASARNPLKELVNTMHFAWFVGQCIQLLSALFYILFSFRIFFKSPSFPLFWYRLSYIAGIVNYSITLSGTYPAKGLQVELGKMIRDSNLHYFLLCFVWLFTKPFMMTLLPFMIYSIGQILGFLRAFLLPSLGYSSKSPTVVKIVEFTRKYSDTGLLMASNVEFTNYLRIIFDLFTFKKQAVLVFMFYTVFMKLRYDDSLFVRSVVQAWEVRIDGLLSHPSLPPVVKQVWINFKMVIRNYLGKISVAPRISSQTKNQ